jgi:hypothetical protein
MGKRINKRAKIQKINARLISTALKEITPKNTKKLFRTWLTAVGKQLRDECFEKERNFVITYCVKGLRVI